MSDAEFLRLYTAYCGKFSSSKVKGFRDGLGNKQKSLDATKKAFPEWQFEEYLKGYTAAQEYNSGR